MQCKMNDALMWKMNSNSLKTMNIGIQKPRVKK